MTPIWLKSLIRTKLESAPDKSKKALAWSGWFWKYSQVVPHSCEIFPLLNAVAAGRLFRQWWSYGDPKEFAHMVDKLLNLAEGYVHKKPLVSSGTKRRHSQGGEESESDSDVSRQSDLDLDDAPPVPKGRLSRKDKVSMAKETGLPPRNHSGEEDIAPEGEGNGTFLMLALSCTCAFSCKGQDKGDNCKINPWDHCVATTKSYGNIRKSSPCTWRGGHPHKD